ncbi:MAG: GNAT family N-acetyltransferase [Bacillota bacterium]|nr:GNAT family N-acetyltransferase [Bacillota bacterium]
MDNYQYIQNFQDNDGLLRSYFNYTQTVFGFDLMDWRKSGHWKDNYIPHAIVFNNQVVAGMGASKMMVQINGSNVPAIQIGSVGVMPEYRGKGLARILMERVLEEYKDYPLIFLFASEDVSKFYTKLGYKRVQEGEPFIYIQHKGKALEAEKISLNSEHLERLLNTKVQRSTIIDARDNLSFYWFHLMYFYEEDIYYIEEKDVIFIASYEDDIVYLHDVLSSNEVTFDEIQNYIIKKSTKQVRFGFTPDWLCVDYQVVPRLDKHIYVIGDFIEDMSNCKFPKTSIT